MPTVQIPLVDFRDHRAGGARRAAFVDALGRGLEAFGFVNVVGHGTPDALLDRAYDVAARCFALSDAAKRRCEAPEIARQRGYTSFGVERARDREMPDLKEFWHVGRDLDPSHPLSRSGEVPANRFPAELPEFGAVMRELFAAQDRFGTELLVAIGEYLGLPEAEVREMVRDGNSVLRVIHYPDLPDAQPGAVRAAEHEDINLLTVLPASTRPGLELMTRDGEWMAVETPPGVMVCDTGDMMQRLTGGVMPATTHRVVNPEGSDGGRLSMPYFMHPHPDFLLRPMRGDAPAVTARDFLLERLRENGVA